ncbi:MAG: response regulator [Deltaproteobacteria bacterium]|nr:response regulator [Deltaproteobacteria bacterium]
MTKILVVDDISENRSLLFSLFEGHGFKVTVAGDGVEALSLAYNNPPDLIITDILMPKMDGFELCRKWKSDKVLYNIPFIIYTATYTDPKDEQLALNLGADYFIIKPKKVEKLLQVVHDALNQDSSKTKDMRQPSSDNMADLLRQYNDALIRKLESKIQQLESEIDRRQKAESELRRTTILLDSIIENIPDLVYLKDAQDLCYIKCNKASAELLGFDSSALQGKNDFDLFSPEQAKVIVQNDREILNSHCNIDVSENSFQTEMKGERIFRTKKVPIFNSNSEPEYLLGIAEDITEFKKISTEREKLQKQLLVSQRLESIGRLAGGVAHDFNNFLSVILCYADSALAKLTDNDSLKTDIDEIKQAGLKSAVLTRQLLTFSCKQLLDPQVKNLNSIILGIENMLRRLLREDIIVDIKLAQDIGNIKADVGQIEQVILNLIINARDAMPHGGKLTIETANFNIDESLAQQFISLRPGAFVLLSVKDSGCGMDSLTQEHIFEPFYTTKQHGKGTGLGLSQVYGIIKQSGGSIQVCSEQNKGTDFKIYLPSVSHNATEFVSKSEPVIKTGNEMVLLVEDEETVRKITEHILQNAGYRVKAAKNGDEALLVCQQVEGNIDLLLTDVVMPQISGRHLAEQIGRLYPSLRTLFMSGYNDSSIIPNNLLKPGTHFITKPFTAVDLIREVRDTLDSHMKSPNS